MMFAVGVGMPLYSRAPAEGTSVKAVRPAEK